MGNSLAWCVGVVAPLHRCTAVLAQRFRYRPIGKAFLFQLGCVQNSERWKFRRREKASFLPVPCVPGCVMKALLLIALVLCVAASVSAMTQEEARMMDHVLRNARTCLPTTLY